MRQDSLLTTHASGTYTSRTSLVLGRPGTGFIQVSLNKS